MNDLCELTVKDVATLSGVSVRTLHYYDEIDLLKPKRRTSGYRIYNTEHILRLQQILIQRSLGLSLASIKAALDEPTFDRVDALKSQREALLNKIDNAKAMVLAIEVAIEKSSDLSQETLMTIKEIFNGFNPADHEAEAQELWGETHAYQMSQKRTQKYTRRDWKQMQTEEEIIWSDAANAMSSGVTPENYQAGDIVARHRRHIDKWFYTTSSVSYASLADMWESDPRFKNNIDKYGEGLTAWFAQAARFKYDVV